LKKILIVSTGRCGTTRLMEILKTHIDSKDFTVVHQMKISRLANIIGNFMYHFGYSDRVASYLFNRMIKENAINKNFISTDALTSMIIPNAEITLADNCIIHIYREPASFAESIYKFSRERRKSFIAHNFFPLWQPFLWPLENILSRKIKNKYIKVANKKYEYFTNRYKTNPNFISISMKEVFKSDKLFLHISKFLGSELLIPEHEKSILSNQTYAKKQPI
jgi:hypothetical protein